MKDWEDEFLENIPAIHHHAANSFLNMAKAPLLVTDEMIHLRSIFCNKKAIEGLAAMEFSNDCEIGFKWDTLAKLSAHIERSVALRRFPCGKLSLIIFDDWKFEFLLVITKLVETTSKDKLCSSKLNQ